MTVMDIGDYHEIMDEFGTMEDSWSFIAVSHDRGMKFILIDRNPHLMNILGL